MEGRTVPDNIALQKSKEFAIRMVRLYRYLSEDRKEFILSKQIVRSGTSIGANLAESECAISRNDFLSKIYIALKEASETRYWLELLYRTDYLSREQYSSLDKDCAEIHKILQSTTKTIKERQKSKE